MPKPRPPMALRDAGKAVDAFVVAAGRQNHRNKSISLAGLLSTSSPDPVKFTGSPARLLPEPLHHFNLFDRSLPLGIREHGPVVVNCLSLEVLFDLDQIVGMGFQI